MRYLLINEYRQQGGTEVQSLRERDLLRSKGHDVMYLTFDPKFPLELSGYDPNIPMILTGASLLFHRIAVSKSVEERIVELVGKFSPDIVHLNNTVAAAATVYKCLEPYPCFQTIRDYGAVCPKGTCVHGDYSICGGYRHSECCSCIGGDAKRQIKNVCLRLLNRRRAQSVDVLVCPSSALSACCTANGLETRVLNNAFDFSIVLKGHPCFSKTYLYYGSISERKGVIALLDAWRDFSSRAVGARLLFVGDVVEGFGATFEVLLSQTPNAEYLGSMNNAEIMELYKEIYCVVVPSLWIENYPNTVLEALANKTLVIGSDRGGIPELIQSKEFLFNVLDKDSIVGVLEHTYEMGEWDYIETTERAYERCCLHNSLEAYYERIMNICNELSES